MLKSGRLSNLPIESLEFNCLKVLFRRFSIRQRHIASHSPNRLPCMSINLYLHLVTYYLTFVDFVIFSTKNLVTLCKNETSEI